MQSATAVEAAASSRGSPHAGAEAGGATSAIMSAQQRPSPALSSLTMRQLKGRARAAGADEAAIDALDDAVDAKAAAMDLVTKLCGVTQAAPSVQAELRAELAGLTMRELKRRARAAGAGDEDIDALDDASDTKGAAIELIIKLTPATKTEAEVRAELQGLKMRDELKKESARARCGGRRHRWAGRRRRYAGRRRRPRDPADNGVHSGRNPTEASQFALAQSGRGA
jgi:hypothetical protein